MLSTKVILLDVTNLSDARYAAGMGVDYIGFSINPVSNNYVTAEDANAISGWLSGVSMIGNLGSSETSYEEYKIDYLLTSNEELATTLDEPIYTTNLSIENQAAIISTLEALADKVSFYILNIKAEELGLLAEELKELNTKYDCFISTDFDDKSLKLALETMPSGIVLYGSHETKPGLSNYNGIADVLELLDEI